MSLSPVVDPRTELFLAVHRLTRLLEQFRARNILQGEYTVLETIHKGQLSRVVVCVNGADFHMKTVEGDDAGGLNMSAKVYTE